MFTEHRNIQLNYKRAGMKTITINNTNDVRNFFQFLYDEYDLIFHPDDSFHEYIDNNGFQMFSSEQADHLDALIQKCFDICGDKIYETLEPIQRAEFRRRGYVL